jgi:predicted RNA-binding Zn ribbon-like protein
MAEGAGKVRGGGLATPRDYLFEISGGSLCLDFTNTVDWRPSPRRRELLNSYEDLISWSEQAGALGGKEARRLRRRAAAQKGRAASVLRRARHLREAIFGVFVAAASDARPPAEALALINEALPGALGRLRLSGGAEGVGWTWTDEPALDRMLWPVLRSAADLLTSGDLDRVRVCAADKCDWLFLDKSRNRSRRWCDMTVCGNRDKVRRHYERSRARA